METIVKQTREVGTSAGVLLPRKWLNKQVVVTLLSPSKEEVAKGVLDILFKQNLNEETKGIYLVGSYARNDYDYESDMDVLVITKEINKLINQDNYEILLVSEKNFAKNLDNNLNYLSMLNEIKVIINKELIEKYSVKKHKPNFNVILVEIKKLFKINKESIKLCKESGKNVPDGIVYSIVLRLRELYLIKCLLSDMPYSKRDFVKITGEKIHSAYSRVKRNDKELNNINPYEIKNLLDLSEKWLKELKG